MVDGDAYGIDIVSVYKFGSQALKHESERLAAERVHCIGLWSSELAEYVPLLFCNRACSTDEVYVPCRFGIDNSSLLSISAADEKKVRSCRILHQCMFPLSMLCELTAMR